MNIHRLTVEQVRESKFRRERARAAKFKLRQGEFNFHNDKNALRSIEVRTRKEVAAILKITPQYVRSLERMALWKVSRALTIYRNELLAA